MNVSSTSGDEHESTDSLVRQASFGIFDGTTTVVGVVFGLLSKGNHTILTAAVGVAAASTCGMAAGEYLSDSKSGLREAAVIGLATGIGTLAPVVPFMFFTKTVALIVAAVIALAFGAAIGFVRRKGVSGYAQTFAILLAASLATVAVTALIPASAGS